MEVEIREIACLRMKKFTKAWDKVNACPVDIRNLPLSRNGLTCGCTCVECDKPLEACQGEKRAWYFRHANRTSCKGGPMTALHLMAQYLLKGNRTMVTREGEVSYSNGEIEYTIPDSRYEADVAGDKSDGTKFLIEIFVTHKLQDEEEKVKLIRKQEIHSIEIDLSKVDLEISRENLLNLLLTDVSKQRVIYSPKNVALEAAAKPAEEKAQQKESTWIEDIVPVAIFVGILVAAYNFFTGSKSNRG